MTSVPSASKRAVKLKIKKCIHFGLRPIFLRHRLFRHFITSVFIASSTYFASPVFYSSVFFLIVIREPDRGRYDLSALCLRPGPLYVVVVSSFHIFHLVRRFWGTDLRRNDHQPIAGARPLHVLVTSFFCTVITSIRGNFGTLASRPVVSQG